MASRKLYNYVVVGVGGIGSGSLYWLSKLSKRLPGSPSVLGIEQFRLGHDNGSSQDVSRIIRYMYHDASYIKLAPGSFDTWTEVEKESGVKLVTKTGGVFFTFKKDGHEDVVEEYAKAMTSEHIPFDRLDGPAIQKRFPQFNVAHKDVLGLYQKDSGFVNAALANAVHTQLARSHGAEILENTKVTKIEPLGDHLKIQTTNGSFECEKLIIASGAWNNDLLKHFGTQVSITVTQEQVTYFGTPNIKEFLPQNFPVWLCHGRTHDFYGIPINPGVNTGMKIAADAAGSIVSPSTRTFDIDEEKLETVTEFLKTVFPRGYGPPLYTKTCLYELTPDRHFILDSLAYKGFPNVFVFMGCGHGFKFASLVGKIFAELTITGKTQYPISENFSIARPALQMMDAKGNIMFGKKSQLPTTA